MKIMSVKGQTIKLTKGERSGMKWLKRDEKKKYNVVHMSTVFWFGDRATLFHKENGYGERKVTYTSPAKSWNKVEKHPDWHSIALPWLHSKTCITAGLKQEVEALKTKIRTIECVEPVSTSSEGDEIKRLRKHNKKLLERLAYNEAKLSN